MATSSTNLLHANPAVVDTSSASSSAGPVVTASSASPVAALEERLRQLESQLADAAPPPAYADAGYPASPARERVAEEVAETREELAYARAAAAGTKGWAPRSVVRR